VRRAQENEKTTRGRGDQKDLGKKGRKKIYGIFVTGEITAEYQTYRGGGGKFGGGASPKGL